MTKKYPIPSPVSSENRNNIEIRSFTPEKKPIIIRKKADIQAARKAAKPPAKTHKKYKNVEEMRQEWIKTRPKYSEYIAKLSNINPAIVVKAVQKMPWAIDLAIKELDDPSKVFPSWFFFFLKNCHAAGEDYIKEKLSSGKSLYALIQDINSSDLRKNLKDFPLQFHPLN